MFVPGVHARVHITGMGNTAQKRHSKTRQRMLRRRVGLREILRMPCLMPTICVVFIGLLVLAGGAGMCVLGYIPNTVKPLNDYDDLYNTISANSDHDPHYNNHHHHNHHHHHHHNNNINDDMDGNINNSTTTVAGVTRDAAFYARKSLGYVGPILMGCGFFAIIVSCVLYCEIVDRYAVLLPSKPQTRLKRRQLLQMILSEFKKSYFRGIEVPLRKQEPPAAKGGERQMETLLKALSISTPVLLMSPDLAPTWRFSHYPNSYRGQHRHMALKPRHPKLKQLGGSGSSGHEPWLKTSSLPNICDPEFRRHHLPRPVVLDQQQEMGRARRMRRFGRPSRSMENRISWSLPQTLTRSSSGVDNPAYLHEQDRKKSVSMCVHVPYPRRPPGATRFVKASQLQPRVRLQQQQQQQIQKQQQQLKQQQQQQQEKQKRLTKQYSSRESDEVHGQRRCGSDGSRPRQRPKLVRTKGAHKSFDSSGESSFSNLVPPAEPPPFPLPAHFIHLQQQQQQHLQPDTLQVVSPRTAKLLRAKCKSEDVRDKRKPDIMLLKDLFRSVDVQDPPEPTPTLTTQMSSASMPCTISAGLTYLDPLAGQRCENVPVAPHPQNNDGTAVIKIQPGRADSAFTRVTPKRQESKTKSEAKNAEVSDKKHVQAQIRQESSPAPDQRYELPLLAGVAGANRQWEKERRKKISSTSRHEEKSHSLDAKDSKSSRLDTKRAEIHRAHSFNFPLAQESRPAKPKLLTMSSKNSQDKEKDSSNFLRVFLPHPHKSRPKSWDGDKSQSLDTPVMEDGGKMSRLAVPRMERASSFDPMASPGRSRDNRQTKQVTSYSSEYVRPVSPYPCRLIFESEIRAGRSHSEEIRHPTPTPSCLTLPVPLQPQRVHSSPDRSSGELASTPQHQHRPPQQQPPQQLLLTVPTVKIPHRQAQSPRLLSPSQPEKTLKPPDQSSRSPRDLSSSRKELSVHELKPPDTQTLKPPTPKLLRHSKTENELCEHKHSRPERQLSEQKSMKHSFTDQNLNESKRARAASSADTERRRATIVHQASVHLSLDSAPDSSMSLASSTPSSTTDNTTSSLAPLLPGSSVSAPYGRSGLPADGRAAEGREDDSANALRRLRYIQSRSVAIEESSPEDEDTENTPLIQNPGSGNAGKS